MAMRAAKPLHIQDPLLHTRVLVVGSTQVRPAPCLRKGPTAFARLGTGTALNCALLWCIVLYCTVQYCTMLYCTVQYSEVLVLWSMV